MIGIVAILLVAFIFVLPIAYMRGMNATASRIPKEIEYKHIHIWGKWEYFKLNIVNGRTGQSLYEQDAQRRVCEDCGYIEVEKIRSKEPS